MTEREAWEFFIERLKIAKELNTVNISLGVAVNDTKRRNYTNGQDSSNGLCDLVSNAGIAKLIEYDTARMMIVRIAADAPPRVHCGGLYCWPIPDHDGRIAFCQLMLQKYFPEETNDQEGRDGVAGDTDATSQTDVGA